MLAGNELYLTNNLKYSIKINYKGSLIHLLFVILTTNNKVFTNLTSFTYNFSFKYSFSRGIF